MSATIDLRLFATLRAYLPENPSRYPVVPGMTVAQLIESLEIPLGDAKLVFVNGVRVDLETTIRGGERVGVFPPVGGG